MKKFAVLSKKEKMIVAIATVAIFILVCVGATIIAITISNKMAEPQYEVSEFLLGTGSSEDPFLISNRADLLCFSQKIASYNSTENDISYVALTADIDLGGIDWVPIGLYGEKEAFRGVFDGNGYTISNCNIKADNNTNVGFFSSVENVTFGITGIKDLNLTGISITSYNNHETVGGLVGSSRGVISNCNVTATISLQGDTKAVGGVVGYTYAEVFDTTSNGTMNISAAETRMQASDIYEQIPVYGGVIGGAMEMGKDVLRCTNNMEINFSDVQNSNLAEGYIEIQIGGVIGSANGSEYIDLVNNADIVGVGSVGGIICDMFGVGVKIYNCVNNGDIYSTSCCNLNVGGILGKTFSSYDNTIENCYNKGDIKAESSDIAINGIAQNYMVWVGGIMGLGKITIENCKVESGITVMGEASHYVGGIIGGSEGSIINSYCVGDIKVVSEKTAMVGGLVGVMQANEGLSIATSCYIGNVQAKIDDAWNGLMYDLCVGGIVGLVMSNDTNINNNYYNTSVISSNGYETVEKWYGDKSSEEEFSEETIQGNAGLTTTIFKEEVLTGFAVYDSENPSDSGVWIFENGSYPKLYWE